MNLRTDDLNALLEPLDPLAAECAATRESIRAAFARARAAVQHWEPRPMPDNWTGFHRGR